ncbi:MAG: M20/M25/M40 family metallo-hydrolase, partial [Gemmatimonadales bacterium]
KGHVKLRLTFEGESAHSGYPHLGRNAIEPAGRAIIALARLREALAAERPALHERFGVVPFVALNVACVHGGLAVNVVPDRCVLDVGFRPLPRMEPEPIIERIRAAVAAALGEVPFSLEMTGESPSMIGAATEVYQRLRESVHQETEATVSYTTDAGWFQRAGMECVIFGPGSIEVAHKPDEYLPIDQFTRAGTILDDLLHAQCVAPVVEQ